MKSFKLKNRMLAALLCLALVGGTVGSLILKGGEGASASDSLAGITELKDSNQEYTILEIVPDVSQAAFAWYVGGSEPVNGKKLSTAYSEDSNSFADAYSSTTNMLQTKTNLLPTTENTDPSQSILKYLGPVVSTGSNNDAVTGGFENNEWFHRYVLDWSEDENQPDVTVLTVTPENVTTSQVELADMVVISGGYYYPDVTVDPASFKTTAGENLSTEVANLIISKATEDGFGLPVILDRRAYNTNMGTELASNRIFHSLLNGDPTTTKSGVYGSVFYYSSVNEGSESGNSIVLSNQEVLGIEQGQTMGFLVTSQFNTPFASEYASASGSFGDVLEGIQAENSTRNAFNQTLLSEDITMARVIRYLVSGDDETSVGDRKDIVKVLSIQPTDSNSYSVYVAGVHDAFKLDAPSVTAQVSLPTDTTASTTPGQVSWEQLENWTGVGRKNIQVTEMSINALVQDVADLSSQYDLIYIGNNVSGGDYGIYIEEDQFKTASTGGNGNYFAVMGTVNTAPKASYIALENDLSLTKLKQLLSFVEAGRPVVVAPYLCGGLNWKTDSTDPAGVSVDSNSNLHYFLEVTSSQSNVMRQDALIAGADGVEGNSDDSANWVSLNEKVHLPNSTIEFAGLSNGKPTAYEDKLGAGTSATVGTSNGQSQLQYIFKIDGTSGSDVNYKVSLTLDMDGDGDYEVNCATLEPLVVEQLQTSIAGDLELDSSNNPVKEQGVETSNLVENKYYRLTATLPDWVQGALPWRLEVVAVKDSGLASSVEELSYVKPETANQVAVLQINLSENTSGNLEQNTTFQQLIGKAQGGSYSAQMAQDVDMNVFTVDSDQFNSMVSGSASLSEVHSAMVNMAKSRGFNTSSTGKDGTLALLKTFDLVLVGFGDVGSEMSDASRTVIENYISAGNSILLADESLNFQDLSFFDGLYATSALRLSQQRSTLSQISSPKLQGYPFNLTQDDDFYVLLDKNMSYTTAAVGVGSSAEDVKYLVNTLSSIISFVDKEAAGPEVEEEDDTPTGAEDIIVYADLGGEEIIKVLPVVVEKPTGTLSQDTYKVYFRLGFGSNATENVKLNLQVGGTTINNATGGAHRGQITVGYASGSGGVILGSDTIYANSANAMLYLEFNRDFIESTNIQENTIFRLNAFAADDSELICTGTFYIQAVTGEDLFNWDEDRVGDYVTTNEAGFYEHANKDAYVIMEGFSYDSNGILQNNESGSPVYSFVKQDPSGSLTLVDGKLTLASGDTAGRDKYVYFIQSAGGAYYWDGFTGTLYDNYNDFLVEALPKILTDKNPGQYEEETFITHALAPFRFQPEVVPVDDDSAVSFDITDKDGVSTTTDHGFIPMG